MKTTSSVTDPNKLPAFGWVTIVLLFLVLCCNLLLAASPCFAVQFMMGAILGQSSVMLPQLQAADSSIQIDDEYASWIASITMIGGTLSAIFCGPLTDTLGRKATIKTFSLLSALGHTIIGVSSDVSELLIGRFCMGVAYGFSFPTFVYVSEISPVQHRSLLLALGTVWSSMGMIYAMFVGGILTWDMTALITACFSTFTLIISFLTPETPAWLFQNHKLDDAIKSLKWLKGDDCDVEYELNLLKDGCSNQPSTKISIFRNLTGPSIRKPLIIIISLAALQNGAGFYAVVFYSINFCSMFKADLDPWLVSVGLAITRLITSVIASYFQKRVPRKILGAFSGFSTAIVLAVLYLYTHIFRDETANSTMYPVVVALCLLLYIFFCSFGIYPLPWVLPYELYPLHVRGVMCGVSYAMIIISSFISVKLFFFFINTLGLYGTVLMFILFSFGFGMFSVFILPETHGKSLAEIQQGFVTHTQKTKNIAT